MKKYKLVTMFSTAILAGASIATIVSCGGVEPAKILQVGIRPETKKLFEKIRPEFEKANPGYKLKWREITNDIGINGSLDAWRASSSMPEVMVMDTSWANIYVKKGWFKSIDLKDIATNKKYMIDNKLVDPEFRYENITDANFNSKFSNMINDSKRGEKQWSHFATGIGPQLSYIWTKGKDKDDKIVNLLDGTQKLKWYVPNMKPANQKNIDEITFSGTTPATSPLYNPETNRPYKNTLDDIKDFVTNSARKDQMKFNGNLTGNEPKDYVMSTGYYGQTQRFISVLLTLKKAFNLNMVPMDGEFWFPFLGPLQGQSVFVNSGTANANENAFLDDDKIFTSTGTRGTTDYKINTQSKPNNKDNLSKLEKQMWYGQLGYYQDGVVKIPKAISSKFSGQGDGMGNGKSLGIGSGGGWMYTWKFGYSRPNAEQPQGTKDFGLESLQAIPLPFEFAGTEGFSVAAGLDAQKDLLAKKFIRFLMQKKVQLILNGTSTMATRISALNDQKPKYPKGLLAITQSGDLIKKIQDDTSHSVYMDVIYNTGKKSTKNLYEQYGESFYKNVAWDETNLKVDPENKFDVNVYVKIIQKTIDDFNRRIKQS